MVGSTALFSFVMFTPYVEYTLRRIVEFQYIETYLYLMMWGGNAWTYAMFKKYKTVILFMIAGS